MSLLPHGFEALESFVQDWALEGEPARAAARSAATPALRRAFYDAAQPLLAPALDYLDGRPMLAGDARDDRLMRMMLSLAHVALAVETLGDTEDRHAAARARVHVEHRNAW